MTWWRDGIELGQDRVQISLKTMTFLPCLILLVRTGTVWDSAKERLQALSFSKEVHHDVVLSKYNDQLCPVPSGNCSLQRVL
jgi:hypothetical protein